MNGDNYRLVDVIDGERSVLLDEAISSVREFPDEGIAPPVGHVAVVVEPAACNQTSFNRNETKSIWESRYH